MKRLPLHATPRPKAVAFLLAVLLCVPTPTARSQTTMKNLIGDLSQWTGVTPTGTDNVTGDTVARWDVDQPASFTYTEPKTYLSGEFPDFGDTLDKIAVEDWYAYRYLAFRVKLPDARPFQIKCTLRPLVIGRPDFVESLSSTLDLQGEGWQTVVFSLRDFDYHHQQGTFWAYIQNLSFTGTFRDGEGDGKGRGDIDAPSEVLITQPWLTKSPRVSLTSPVRSKPGDVDEVVTYDITVQNESHRESRVALVLADTAWEACPAELSTEHLVIAPRSSETVQLAVTMSQRVAPGGRESRTVTAIPDGRGDLKQELRFTTVHRLAHPYLMHTEAGWQAVIEKAERVDWAKEARERYLEQGRAWQPPAVRSVDYNYPHKEANRLLECAVAWKLSGDEALAEKAIRFLRDFTDPEKGYPQTIRCNNGAHVHRGMFFLRVAQSYDLLFNHPSPDGRGPRPDRPHLPSVPRLGGLPDPDRRRQQPPGRPGGRRPDHRAGHAGLRASRSLPSRRRGLPRPARRGGARRRALFRGHRQLQHPDRKYLQLHRRRLRPLGHRPEKLEGPRPVRQVHHGVRLGHAGRLPGHVVRARRPRHADHARTQRPVGRRAPDERLPRGRLSHRRLGRHRSHQRQKQRRRLRLRHGVLPVAGPQLHPRAEPDRTTRSDLRHPGSARTAVHVGPRVLRVGQRGLRGAPLQVRRTRAA